MPLKMIIFNKKYIIEFMRNAKLTDKQFCAICKIDKLTYLKIISEKEIEADEKAVRIAILLDIPVSKLLLKHY